jgi:hypothetical protein
VALTQKEQWKQMISNRFIEHEKIFNWLQVNNNLLKAKQLPHLMRKKNCPLRQIPLKKELTKSQDYEDNWEENAKSPAKEDVLLVYPFYGGDAIEKDAKGLFLYEEKQCNASFLLQLQKEKCHPRNVSLIISKKDCEHLEPGKWLNDILIDFWMQWITQM